MIFYESCLNIHLQLLGICQLSLIYSCCVSHCPSHKIKKTIWSFGILTVFYPHGSSECSLFHRLVLTHIFLSNNHVCFNVILQKSSEVAAQLLLPSAIIITTNLCSALLSSVLTSTQCLVLKITYDFSLKKMYMKQSSPCICFTYKCVTAQNSTTVVSQVIQQGPLLSIYALLAGV